MDLIFDEIEYQIKKQPDKLLRQSKDAQTNFILQSQAKQLLGILKQNSEKSLVKNASLATLSSRGGMNRDEIQDYKNMMPVLFKAEELGVAMMNKKKLAQLSRNNSFMTEQRQTPRIKLDPIQSLRTFMQKPNEEKVSSQKSHRLGKEEQKPAEPHNKFKMLVQNSSQN